MTEGLPTASKVPPPRSRSFFAGRGRLLVGAVLLLGALSYFAFAAFQGSAVYYLRVSELLEREQEVYGKTVRVTGKLVPESFTREPGSTLATFSVTDGVQQVRAQHIGVLPDLFFNEESDIMLEGRYSPNGVFTAENVMVKCPSKYASASEANGGSGSKR